MTERRLYPFSRSVPTTSSNTANASTVVVTTTYKPNPFHGIDRWVFAFDEWCHRNLNYRVHRWLFGWLCDWWDKRVLDSAENQSPT